jgi:peptidoglycan/xylan/chitin deacetylase (PgdA/CDA1 family)
VKSVIISFDLEEFDMPLEYGKMIEFEEQIRMSYEGTQIILDILSENQIKSTFFSTVVFAAHAKDLIARLCTEGHELASHGYYHSRFESDHLLKSKIELERISGASVRGFRMPRMGTVDNNELRKAGYIYNSSLNPIYLPGRYNNFFRQRTIHTNENLVQIPASATPIIRLPLFWLSFHNFPTWLYKKACQLTMNSDGYLNIYFHPWEFLDISDSYGLPQFVSKNTGRKMIDRFRDLIGWMKEQKYDFTSVIDFLPGKQPQP